MKVGRRWRNGRWFNVWMKDTKVCRRSALIIPGWLSKASTKQLRRLIEEDACFITRPAIQWARIQYYKYQLVTYDGVMVEGVVLNKRCCWEGWASIAGWREGKKRTEEEKYCGDGRLTFKLEGSSSKRILYHWNHPSCILMLMIRWEEARWGEVRWGRLVVVVAWLADDQENLNHSYFEIVSFVFFLTIVLSFYSFWMRSIHIYIYIYMYTMWFSEERERRV